MIKNQYFRKFPGIWRLRRLDPILFLIPFVIVAGILFLFLTKGEEETKFRLFAPAWRGLGVRGEPAQIPTDPARLKELAHFTVIFGGQNPQDVRTKIPGAKSYKYTLGPYVTSDYIPCNLIPDDPDGSGPKPGPKRAGCGSDHVLPDSAVAKSANGKALYARNFLNNFLIVPDDNNWLEVVRNTTIRDYINYRGSTTNRYDGLITDSMGTAPADSTAARGYLNDAPINPNTNSPYTDEQWLAAEQHTLRAKRAGIAAAGDKDLVMNGLAKGDDYWASPVSKSTKSLLGPNAANKTVDGAMAESIFRNAGDGLNNWRATDKWLKDVKMIQDVENTYGIDGYWWSKCWSGGPSDDAGENVTCNQDEGVSDPAQRTVLMTQWRRFTMGSYLLAAGPHSYYNWDTDKNDNNAAEYFADYDKAIALGSAKVATPNVDAAKVSGNLYKREFSKGLVLVNADNANGATFTLPSGKTYKDLDGNNKSGTITIAAHTATILIDITAGGGDSSASLKPQIAGVIDPFGSPAPEDYQGVVNGFIVKVNWKDLQPNPGGEIAANNAIDRAITTARNKNLKLKVRLFGGVQAPDWAKQIGGSDDPNDKGPVITVHDSGSGSGPVGRFWTDAYGAAYQDLQNKLAAKYDNTPELVDITISRCMTIYAEPFLRESFGDANAENRTAYKNAGYTLAQDAKCQHDQIDAHKVWTKTRSSLAFNPYQKVNDNGTDGGTDENFTETMIDYCRSSLGDRCVLGNNSISAPWVGTNGDCSASDTSTVPIHRMYCKIKSKGPPIYYQAAHPSNRDSYDFDATLNKSISYGAGMVELPQGYHTSGAPVFRTPSQLTPFDNLLEANASGGSGGGGGGTTTGPSAAAAKGIWMVWGNPNTAKRPYVKGGQVVGSWLTVEPAKDTFNWANLGDSIEPASASDKVWGNHIKNYTDPSSAHYVDKPFTIQINSSKKPKDSWWGYGPTIAWCGTFGPKANPDLSFDVPQFWVYSGSGGGVNNDYIQLGDKLISELAKQLKDSGYKSDILGVRTAPNLIGTEHHDFKSDQISEVPANPACDQTKWNKDWGDAAYNTIMNKYKTYFEGSGVKPIFRARANALASPNGGMFFDTNANPDNDAIYSNNLYYDKAKNGNMLPYTEPYQRSNTYTSPVTWNWWLILQALDRGVPYIAVYGDDLNNASNEACPENIVGWTGNAGREYQAAYCFANKYAPYANAQNTAAQAQASPGAWIAFTRRDHSHGSSGALGMYLTASDISDTTSSPANIAIPKTSSNDAVAATGVIGSTAQRYGRYARSISGSQKLSMQLDNNFKASLSGTVNVNIVYLDSGTGKWILKWGTASGHKVEKTNTNTWKTVTAEVPVSDLGSGMLTLEITEGSATTFHMVEILRSGTTTPPPPPPTDNPPTVSLTAPTAATVSGTTNITANATDDNAVTKVEFYANSTLLGTDTTAPYSYSWDTKTTANGNYTLKAVAHDAKPQSTTSATVNVTVANDKTPPAVSLTSPANGQKVSGPIQVAANASDNVDVVKVEFYINGVLKTTVTAAPYKFNWNTTDFADGSYTITAKAHDAAGNIGTSAAVNVTVENKTTPPPDTQIPTVTISKPANGATVDGKVQIAADANDNVGVTAVKLYINGSLAGTDSAGTFRYLWDVTDLPNGPYAISVVAEDAAGNKSAEAKVQVNVHHPDPPEPPAKKKGDLNNDDKVDIFDLSILAKNWQKRVGKDKGDLNEDGVVDIFDLSILAKNWSNKK